ncbi:MAG: ATP-binding cassette domain-containing protein [Acetobacteraceae bacterium]
MRASRLSLPSDSSPLQLAVGIGLVVISVVLPAVIGSGYWAHNFLVVNLFVTVAVLQNLLLADAGQVSFGQGAVFGLAATTTGIVTGLWHYSYGLGFLAGVGAALLLGFLFALPALRVQGYYLGFVTLSAAVVFPQLLVAFNSVTNGINGIAVSLPGLTRQNGAGLSWTSLMVVAAALAALVGHAAFRSTGTGRRMRVAAVSPEAAMTLGIDPGKLRFLAFTLAALGTGVAGALYVPVLGFVSPYAFRVDLSIFFFFSVIVGGSGQLVGPVIGVWILNLIPNAIFAELSIYRLLAYGVVALLIMLAFPDGVVGSLVKAARSRRLLARVPPIELGQVLAYRGDDPGTAESRPTGPAITVRAARKQFGRLVALDSVDLSVAGGRVHGLVGPNGSGKTTLLNVISGLIRLDGGEVRVRDKITSRLPAYRLAALGFGRTFQTPRVFEEMSIWQNLEIGADLRGGHHWLLRVLRPFHAAWSAGRPDVLAHAQRRVLETLRMIATDADVLLLDEPAAGLSPEERRDFATLIRFLRDRLGKTILLVEHDLHLVWRVADRISVLDAGQIVAEGAPAEIADNPRVRALFTGSVDAAGR